MPYHILTVTPDAALSRNLGNMLGTRDDALQVEPLESVDAAVERLGSRGEARIAALLCDAGALADAEPNALRLLRKVSPDLPIVVLTDTANEDETHRHAGATDCLSRDRLDAYWLRKYLLRISASRAAIAADAQHDALTNLPNRVLLQDRLKHAIALARRHRTRIAVVFVDIDRFKHINDSLGHAIGDELLRSTARRLSGCVRHSDTVSRLAGDEFVLILDDLSKADDASLIADKILIAMNAPHPVDGRDLHVTVSMGISVYPDDGGDVESIIRNADIAMYHAKEAGRNSYQFFRTQMNVRAAEQHSLEHDLHAALDRGELELYFQPKVELASSAISGVEALARWRHPKRGIVMPDQFIPVAENCGLIVPIGYWVLQEACRQASEWLAMGSKPMRLSVNISAVELRSQRFLDSLQAALDTTGLPPDLLELELTETALIQSSKTADTVLRSVKAMGVGIALDDFGTGYSSLSLLKRFPVDTIKIDQSFIHDMTTDVADAAIVRAVIAMARPLRRNVVAEGVETREQLEMLRAEGCAQGQGYYFGRPTTAAALERRMRQNQLGQRIYLLA